MLDTCFHGYRLPNLYFARLDYKISNRVHLMTRLQLKGGLFLYRHYPQIHEMISEGARADFWTDLRELSMCVVLIQTIKNMTIRLKETQQ